MPLTRAGGIGILAIVGGTRTEQVRVLEQMRDPNRSIDPA